MQVQLPSYIQFIHGKIDKKSTLVYRTRNGKVHAYHLLHPYHGPRTEKQKRITHSFTLAVKLMSVILKNAALRSLWEVRYQQYMLSIKMEHAEKECRRYRSLRGFIVGILIRQFYSLAAENADISTASIGVRETNAYSGVAPSMKSRGYHQVQRSASQPKLHRSRKRLRTLYRQRTAMNYSQRRRVLRTKRDHHKIIYSHLEALPQGLEPWTP